LIIFNLTAVGQAVLGVLIAVASILGLIGLSVVGVLPSSGPTNLFVVLIPAASLTVVDLGFRLLRGPGKNDKTKNYLVDPLIPWRGGHVFFVPVWIPMAAISAVCTYALLVETYRAMF
jgi:hypothetical protein